MIAAYPIHMGDREPGSSAKSRELRFQFEIERETDGRWIAEIPEVPGAMAYGTTMEEAKAKAAQWCEKHVEDFPGAVAGEPRLQFPKSA